jgi:hypothetical protein
MRDAETHTPLALASSATGSVFDTHLQDLQIFHEVAASYFIYAACQPERCLRKPGL